MLGTTVSAISTFIGKVEPARDVMTDEAIAAYEEKLIKQAQEESLRLHVSFMHFRRRTNQGIQG